MRGGSLMRYGANIYSQNGEDGVICEIMSRLNIRNGTFVEFGVGDGRTLSNTLLMAESGWFGLWIEADVASCVKASKEAAKFGGRVEVRNLTVELEGFNSLDSILGRSRVIRHDPSFMSIDIDSYDLQVWESLKNYRPLVMLIEINSSVPIGVEQVHGNGKQGASFTSMMKVATAKGYKLACHTGNLIFVVNELHGRLGLPVREQERPETIFNTIWAEMKDRRSSLLSK